MVKTVSPAAREMMVSDFTLGSVVVCRGSIGCQVQIFLDRPAGDLARTELLRGAGLLRRSSMSSPGRKVRVMRFAIENQSTSLLSDKRQIFSCNASEMRYVCRDD